MQARRFDVVRLDRETARAGTSADWVREPALGELSQRGSP
jgi:hypothetical protein